MRDPVHCQRRRGPTRGPLPCRAVRMLAVFALAVVALSACGLGGADDDPGSDTGSRTLDPTPTFPTGGKGECFNRSAPRMWGPLATTTSAPIQDVTSSSLSQGMTTSLACADETWSALARATTSLDDVGKSASTEGDVHYSSQIKDGQRSWRGRPSQSAPPG